jgi:phosphatidylserine/phosphatidylglycerophosphate/cardiolipin synthase-like enzyme
MAKISDAKVIANNEVAFLAWKTEPASIPECLGFHIVREYLGDDGKPIEKDERPLAVYVAFKGQSNPKWLPQNTAVWPVQRFSWRDLTLRRKRTKPELRPEKDVVRYRIRAVGNIKAGMEEVKARTEQHYDKATKKWVDNDYAGTPRKLGYLTGPAYTNAITVQRRRGPFISTFTNGILSTQFLIKVLEEDDGKIKPGELEAMLRKPGNKIRNYLAGDVLTTIEEFFKRPGGRLHAALYELEDEQLLDILKANAPRMDLILSDAGGDDKTKTYDTRNAKARSTLRAIAKKPGSTFNFYDRLFNGTGHIGHNKFVVHVDGNGKPKAVLTGSTNWTWSGVAGQSNNLIVIEDDKVAKAFFDYWTRLQADTALMPVPNPLSAKNKAANQSDVLKNANRTPVSASLGGGVTAECWFSPNMPGKQQPPAKKKATASPTLPLPPPDVASMFEVIRKAESLILFAVFLPSQGGTNSIIEEAIAMGTKDPTLTVVGAISDRQAMWNFRPSGKTPDGKKIPAWSPHTFRTANVDVVRATAMTDKEIRQEVGDFSKEETLTLGKAIIHAKILVVDPLDPQKCVVAFGSHNLGYKASYSNDENLVVIRGHQELALAYAAHVLDVWDHYRFRAVEAENSEKDQQGWEGFLKTSDVWQKKASRRLARLFAG